MKNQQLTTEQENLIKYGNTASIEFQKLGEEMTITKTALSALEQIGVMTNVLGALRHDQTRSPSERSKEAQKAKKKLDLLYKQAGETATNLERVIDTSKMRKVSVLSEPIDSVIAAQIAESMRNGSPETVAAGLKQPQVIAALAKAPAFVFGLKDEQVELARTRYLKDLYPEFEQEEKQHEKAQRLMKRTDAYYNLADTLISSIVDKGNVGESGIPKTDTSSFY